jgi:hypothetical protein
MPRVDILLVWNWPSSMVGGETIKKQIGKVTHYFDRIGVAVLELEDGFKMGDRSHILGRRTDFVQQIRSMEIEHCKMQVVVPAADVALKVDEVVHEGDEVYLIT